MQTLRNTLAGVLSEATDDDACDCRVSVEDDSLVVDASDCAEDGRLEASEACRRTVVQALATREATTVRVVTAGIERVYETDSAALLVAAGRFVERVRHHDERLAERATHDPFGACWEATGRADAVADIAAETGLAEVVAGTTSLESALAPVVGLTISDWRIESNPPPDGVLRSSRTFDDGDTVRIYETNTIGQYVLEPLSSRLDATGATILAKAHDQFVERIVETDDYTPVHALRAVVSERDESVGDDSALSVRELEQVLHRHTRGHGLLDVLFADPAVSDVFVTAPAQHNRLWVTASDRTLPTNVRLTERGVETLASRYRRESGRGFSRADPTLDAATTIDGRRIRVAGVTEPASDGVAFAFRAHDNDCWTLPALVANDTLPARAAALLSLAVERGAAILVAGPRGAGKTTLLSALLPELPPAVRTVVIEDAPELPVRQLQAHGRDVQALRAASDDEMSATDAVRTALRLGDGALVVGEIRGEEAGALYEAMRVGANSEAVLGTVHGDGAAAVYDRVVDDLGVPTASFGVTDTVVTLEHAADGNRRVRAIEEVQAGSTSFPTLFDREDGSLDATGRLARGNATLFGSLQRPDERYTDLLDLLATRTESLAERAKTGRTSIEAVAATPTEPSG